MLGLLEGDHAEAGAVKALDLFCGAAGGWHLACERVGIDVVAACEIDPWRRACYSQRWPDTLMLGDVRDVGRHNLPGGIGLVVGSPPCQDASGARWSKGDGVDGARTGLFLEALRLVRELRPRWVCLENVAEIRTRGADRIIAEFQEARYACWPFVVGAVHAGAPHRRLRSWFTARNTDEFAQPHFTEHDEVGGQQGGRGAATDTACGVRTSQPQVVLKSCGERPARPRSEFDGRRALPQEWNGGAPDFGRVDDGLSRGLAQACSAAYGDAIVPQVAEAILKSILAVNRSLTNGKTP